MKGAVERGRELCSVTIAAVTMLTLAALIAPGPAAAGAGDIYVTTSSCAGTLGTQDCSLWKLEPDTLAGTKVADFAPRGPASVAGPAFEFRGDAVVGLANLQSQPGSLLSYDPDTSEVEEIAQGGGLLRPEGIALSPRGDLLVADEGQPPNATLFNVDPNLGTIKAVASLPYPALDVAAAPSGEAYVVGATGTVFAIGPNGGAVTPLSTDGAGLWSVAVSSDGKLYVGDCGNSCGAPPSFPASIKQIDPDNGRTIRTYPVQFLNEPTGISLDPTGSLLVTDAGGQLNQLDLDTGIVTKLFQFQGVPTGVDVEPPNCGGKTATLVGTTGRDKLRGSNRRDVIAGLGGRDVLSGLGGNDLICGGSGVDALLGGAGRDSLLGGKHRDRLHGGAGRDRCIGAQGRDAGKACEKRNSLGWTPWG